jgi:uncharacterized membrane protein
VLSLIVDFTSLLLSALLVGAMFCVWLFLNPAHLDASRYIILQQHGIRTLHPAMPRLGAITIAFTLAAAFVARHDRPRMCLLIVAAIFFIISGVITNMVNMPINRDVIHWSSSAPPDNWTAIRDRWWYWHKLRAATGTFGLVLLIVAVLLRDPESAQSLASLFSIRPLLNAIIQGMSLLL